MKVTTIGLDLAKNVFQVHGVDAGGAAVLRKQLKRDQVAPFFACMEPCLTGIEACGGAHFWAAKLNSLGHRWPFHGSTRVSRPFSGRDFLTAAHGKTVWSIKSTGQGQIQRFG